MRSSLLFSLLTDECYKRGRSTIPRPRHLLLFTASAHSPSPIQTSPPIAPSPYQTFLSSNHSDSTEDDAPVPPVVETTRYWSDYNRVYYHPRSMNPLPAVFRRVKDEVGLGQGMGSWGEGEEGWRGLEGVRLVSLIFSRHLRETEADAPFSVCVSGVHSWTPPLSTISVCSPRRPTSFRACRCQPTSQRASRRSRTR